MSANASYHPHRPHSLLVINRQRRSLAAHLPGFTFLAALVRVTHRHDR